MSQQTKSKVKILYVITKSNWGGAQKYVYNLATSLPENFDVAVALGGEGPLKTKLAEAGIRVIPLPWLSRDVNPIADLLVFQKLISLFKKERPDIIHVNSSKIGGLGAFAGRIAKVPKIIFTAHGWAFREDRPEFQKIIIRFLSWLTILFSHVVITVSKRDESEGLAMPFAKKKIILINNGIEEPDFLPKETARKMIIEQGGISIAGLSEMTDETLWLGTIGELHKNKGHIYAIEALASWNPPHGFLFFIIGEGEERKHLEERIKKLNLTSKVILLGKKENASDLLHAFDIFLFPSTKEGLPYAILEAGLAKLPVVASAVGGIPEIIDDMETGILVRPKSSEEIAKAFDYFENHQIKIKALGQKLFTKVKKNFSFKKMLRETEEVYEVNKTRKVHKVESQKST